MLTAMLNMLKMMPNNSPAKMPGFGLSLQLHGFCCSIASMIIWFIS
jgi:hypothetical protein